MTSIDFEDYEPALTPPSTMVVGECPYFVVKRFDLPVPKAIGEKDDFAVVTCISGVIDCGGLTLKSGDFMLLPACLRGQETNLIPISEGTSFLETRLPVA
jgi:hypothetical protein